MSDALVSFGPWTVAGEADPDFDEATRTVHQTLLTDPSLLTCFRQRFPKQRDADYDTMVRLLDYVWDCPGDGAANVTGHCCAVCGRTRAGMAQGGSGSVAITSVPPPAGLSISS